MLRGYGAEHGITRPCPEAVLMRSKIAVVFAKDDRGSVGYGLAHSVIRKITPEALSVCVPALSPLFGAVLPLANSRSCCLAQEGMRRRPCRKATLLACDSLRRRTAAPPLPLRHSLNEVSERIKRANLRGLVLEVACRFPKLTVLVHRSNYRIFGIV